jgi:uncharacterized cupredoxin-like copper-binding protein
VLVACGGGDGPGDQPPGDQAADVTLVGTDSLTFEPEEASAAAGEVTIALTCAPGINHNVTVDGTLVAECAPGETATGSIELEAGDLEFVCTVPGHERSMRGTLSVG